LEWLGLLSDRKLKIGTASVFEMFSHTLKHRLVYDEGEMDLLVMHHEFEAIYPGLPRQRIQSTLIDCGDPDGDSSMSRTVGYPVGIAAGLIADGQDHPDGCAAAGFSGNLHACAGRMRAPGHPLQRTSFRPGHRRTQLLGRLRN
jgi:saccharopine dehydrogenase-like NADP-dependent oxidoreductase